MGRRSVRLSNHNLYGGVDWERGGGDFKAVCVSRPKAQGHTINWSIALVAADDSRLFIGEHELGSLDHDRAVALPTSLVAIAVAKLLFGVTVGASDLSFVTILSVSAIVNAAVLGWVLGAIARGKKG